MTEITALPAVYLKIKPFCSCRSAHSVPRCIPGGLVGRQVVSEATPRGCDAKRTASGPPPAVLTAQKCHSRPGLLPLEPRQKRVESDHSVPLQGSATTQDQRSGHGLIPEVRPGSPVWAGKWSQLSCGPRAPERWLPQPIPWSPRGHPSPRHPFNVWGRC